MEHIDCIYTKTHLIREKSIATLFVSKQTSTKRGQDTIIHVAFFSSADAPVSHYTYSNREVQAKGNTQCIALRRPNQNCGIDENLAALLPGTSLIQPPQLDQGRVYDGDSVQSRQYVCSASLKCRQWLNKSLIICQGFAE